MTPSSPPRYKLKAAFLKTYNSRHKRNPIDAEKCLLAKSDGSYLCFSKDIIPDDQLIGDAFCENEEIFVVTENDVEELDAEVQNLKKIIEDYEQEAHKNATIDALKVVDMTTVSTSGVLGARRGVDAASRSRARSTRPSATRSSSA